MDINSLQGAAAYATAQNITPPDYKSLQGENSETSETGPFTKQKDTAQKAFEVSLSPEAKDIQAEQTTENPLEVEATLTEKRNNPVETSMVTASRIVDTVA